MMDTLAGDLDKEMQEAEFEEKDARLTKVRQLLNQLPNLVSLHVNLLC